MSTTISNKSRKSCASYEAYKKKRPSHISNVYIYREEDDLKLLHYDDNMDIPTGASSDWKGIIMNGDKIIARSYPWAPCVIVNDIPESQKYTKYYEGTIIRFYDHNGPKISTHRQIDIKDKRSRVPGSGRLFVDLINESIEGWNYSQKEYDIPSGGKGIAQTPTSWKELCTPGWCHVFLLIDISNQITNLSDLSEVVEVEEEDGLTERVFMTPKLLHAISFKIDDQNMIPHVGDIITNIDEESMKKGIVERKLIVPTIQSLTHEEAQDAISSGGAVVGYDPAYPHLTTKYFSIEYANKVELAGETFNHVHRDGSSSRTRVKRMLRNIYLSYLII